jgi:hypothetical protein
VVEHQAAKERHMGQISIHETKIFSYLNDHQERWLSNRELCSSVSGVAFRTVCATTNRFVKAGLLEEAQVFPGKRFRWSKAASRKSKNDYLLRLQDAAAIFTSAGDGPVRRGHSKRAELVR